MADLAIGPLQPGSAEIGALQSPAAAPALVLRGEADGGAAALAAITVGVLLRGESDGAARALATLARGPGDLDSGALQSGSGLDIGALQSHGSGGGGGAGILLAGEADGAGNALANIVGPAVGLAGEADGAGNAQARLVVAIRLRCEADGAGNAQCFLGGGMVSITCIVSTGVTAGSPPAPQSTALYDIPSAW